MKNSNLILLHGALGCKNQLEPLKKILAKDFNVYTFNFEGHGGRSTSADFSMNGFTENVLGFMEEHNLNHSSFFGYSMGGYVALNTALRFPNNVESIVTYGTKFDWSENATQKEVRMLNPDKMEEKVLAFTQHLAQLHAPLDWKKVVRMTADMMTNLSKGLKLTENDFQEIQHRVIIGIGTKDQMVSIEESQSTADQLGNGEIVVLKDMVHPIEKLDPEKLAAFIQMSLNS